MIVLIIIGALLLIFALINWEQSQGFFRKLLKIGSLPAPSEEEKTSGGELTSQFDNENKTAEAAFATGNSNNSINFSHDEAYAYDDDLDYSDNN